MKKLISLTLALVMIVTCLSGICFAADPIAKVVTGDKTVEVTTLEELSAAVSPKGTSVVTLLKDITADAMTTLPVCTIDLNGHTWKTTKSNVIQLLDDLSDNENFYSVIKNGTLHGASSAIRHEGGGLKITDCTLRGDGSATIQILDEASKGNYNDGNIIENSTLICTVKIGVLAFNRAADFSSLSYTIKNASLISAFAEGFQVISKKSGSTPGTMILGNDVKLYGYKTDDNGYVGADIAVKGEALTKNASTQTVEALGQSYAGLTMWSTPAASAPVVPETPAAPSTPAVPETPAAPSTPAVPETPAAPSTPAVPETPAAPSVPTTSVPDVEVPKTGASVIALGVMAMVSLAGAVISKKH